MASLMEDVHMFVEGPDVGRILKCEVARVLGGTHQGRLWVEMP